VSKARESPRSPIANGPSLTLSQMSNIKIYIANNTQLVEDEIYILNRRNVTLQGKFSPVERRA
jgi:hypothetical protein